MDVAKVTNEGKMKEKKDMICILGNQVAKLQNQIYEIQVTGEIPPLTYSTRKRKSFKRFVKENEVIKQMLDENVKNKIKDLEYQLKKMTKIVKMNGLGKEVVPLHITGSRYIRIATYMKNIEELLNDIVNCKEDRYELPNGYKVKPDSLRYLTFNQNLECVNCGLKGRFLALEKCINDPGGNEGRKEGQGFHLNLYALDNLGREVLMTKDHIIPKSKGGTDDLSNLQTMCTHCNENKSNIMPTEKELEKWSK